MDFSDIVFGGFLVTEQAVLLVLEREKNKKAGDRNSDYFTVTAPHTGLFFGLLLKSLSFYASSLFSRGILF